MSAKPSIRINDSIQRLISQHGYSKWGIIARLAKLVAGPRRLMPDEAIMFGLLDDDSVDAATFQGNLTNARLNARLCDPGWRFVLEDKVLSATVLQAHGLPITKTVAISGSPRRYPGAKPLTTKDELNGYLQNLEAPVFAKPIYGLQSRGTGLIERRGDSLFLNGETDVESAALAAAIFAQEGGYMVQECLIQHQALRAAVGNGVSTIRYMLIYDEGRVSPQRAVWKICDGGNKADNFWRENNLLGLLDMATGQVERAITQTENGVEEVSHHSDTGCELAGFELPFWPQITQLAAAAAPLFPGIRVQSYDIAITGTGPVIVEVNDLGDFKILQLGQKSGIWNAHMAKLVSKKPGKAQRQYSIKELTEQLNKN